MSPPYFVCNLTIEWVSSSEQIIEFRYYANAELPHWQRDLHPQIHVFSQVFPRALASFAVAPPPVAHTMLPTNWVGVKSGLGALGWMDQI